MSFTDDDKHQKGGTRGGTPTRNWQVGDQAVLNHREVKHFQDAGIAAWALERGRAAATVLGVRDDGYVVLLWNQHDNEVSIVPPTMIHFAMQSGDDLWVADDERDED
jgi:hypothetical protein